MDTDAQVRKGRLPPIRVTTDTDVDAKVRHRIVVLAGRVAEGAEALLIPRADGHLAQAREVGGVRGIEGGFASVAVSRAGKEELA